MLQSTRSTQPQPSTIRQGQLHGFVVLVVDGPVGSMMLADLCDALDRLQEDQIVVDLSGVALADSAFVRDLLWILQLGLEADSSCVVARSQSSRSMLRQAAGCQLPVFATVADAVQAQLFARHGYGNEWHLTSVGAARLPNSSPPP